VAEQAAARLQPGPQRLHEIQDRAGVVGHITAEELRRYLTRTESADGFGNRFLWLWVKRSKALPFGSEMPLDGDAGERWAAVYEELREGKLGLGGALLARGEAHVRRLAAIYALLDLSAVVQRVHLEAALALWGDVEAPVAYIFGDDTDDPLADDILRSLRAAPAGLTRTEINNLLGRHTNSTAIGKALALLQQHRLAHCRQDSTGGRPSERWFCGPATEAK
jgi:hypothetical protein